jgi:hypothetical protein
MSKKSKNYPRIILILIALLTFLFVMPGGANYYYKIYSGSSFKNELKLAEIKPGQFITKESRDLMVSKSGRDGLISTILMVNGSHLPLLLITILIIVITTTPLNKTINKGLFKLFPFFIGWGIVCMGSALLVVDFMANPFPGVLLIWFGLSLLFGIFLSIGLSIRFFLVKYKYPNINNTVNKVTVRKEDNCQNCGFQYYPTEYDQSMEIWYCSKCKQPISKIGDMFPNVTE